MTGLISGVSFASLFGFVSLFFKFSSEWSSSSRQRTTRRLRLCTTAAAISCVYSRSTTTTTTATASWIVVLWLLLWFTVNIFVRKDYNEISLHVVRSQISEFWIRMIKDSMGRLLSWTECFQTSLTIEKLLTRLSQFTKWTRHHRNGSLNWVDWMCILKGWSLTYSKTEPYVIRAGRSDCWNCKAVWVIILFILGLSRLWYFSTETVNQIVGFRIDRLTWVVDSSNWPVSQKTRAGNQ